MGEIDFTNIIIDDFRKGKLNPFNKYIYILTHIHSDHLRGLNNSWNYGPIYCTKITAALIVNKYPNLAHCVKVLSLEEPHKITLAENMMATITFFDANHCAGSIMVLLEGYFGRFLYTGDFRFDKNKFRSYSYLYPPENYNEIFEECSRPIDKLWLDNTFCNPKFKFLAQQQALQLVTKFVRQNQKHIYIGLDYYGKQQVLVHIAKELDTIIVVDERRYQAIIAMDFDRELFTTNPQEGRIQAVLKSKLHDKLLQNPDAIGLVMSGWCIQKEWKKVRGTQELRIFYVPYSLHSNYDEIVAFVKSIKPSIISPVVAHDEQENRSTQSMYNTEGSSQAFKNLVKLYTIPLSATYKKNLQDKQFKQALKERLGLDRKTVEINKKFLGMETVHMPSRGRGGYKLSQQRDEEQIRRVKQDFQRSREKRFKAQSIVINDESEKDSSVELIEIPSKPPSNRKSTKEKKVRQEQMGNQVILRKVQLEQIEKIQIMNGQEIKELLWRQIKDTFIGLR